jgi:Fe2+ or Zn2+ uptake regulation protein
VVEQQDEATVRDIFDRMNNSGKRLSRAEVFSALHPSNSMESLQKIVVYALDQSHSCENQGGDATEHWAEERAEQPLGFEHAPQAQAEPGEMRRQQARVA